jgi:hypothetical protein
MAFTTARAFCKLSCGSLQNGLAPGANISQIEELFSFNRDMLQDFAAFRALIQRKLRWRDDIFLAKDQIIRN